MQFSRPNKRLGQFVMDSSVRVIIKRNACCGYGICAEICPEVYKLDENNLVYVDNDIVPPELVASAREGAEACPQSALATEPVAA